MLATLVALEAAAETALAIMLEIAAGTVDVGATEMNVAASVTDTETDGMLDVIEESSMVVVVITDVDTGGDEGELETGGGGSAEDVDAGSDGATVTDVVAGVVAPAISTTMAMPASADFRLLAVWKPSTSKS